MNTRLKKINGNFCNICQKNIAGTSFKLKSHLYKHNVVKPRFSCDYCQRKFFRKDIFDNHVDKHMGKTKPKKTYICDYCDRSFVDKRNLIVHLKVHDETFSFQPAPFKCLACDASYCEQRLLNYHTRKMHYNLLRENKNTQTKDLNETWFERVNKTDICVEMTKVNHNVVCIKKIGVINGLKKDKIPFNDNEKIKFREYMNSVFAKKDNTQYSKAICDYCNKEMLKKSLIQHIRARHLKLRKFKCEECDCSFQRHYQFVNHACGQVQKYKMKVKRL